MLYEAYYPPLNIYYIFKYFHAPQGSTCGSGRGITRCQTRSSYTFERALCPQVVRYGLHSNRVSYEMIQCFDVARGVRGVAASAKSDFFAFNSLCSLSNNNARKAPYNRHANDHILSAYINLNLLTALPGVD